MSYCHTTVPLNTHKHPIPCHICILVLTQKPVAQWMSLSNCNSLYTVNFIGRLSFSLKVIKFYFLVFFFIRMTPMPITEPKKALKKIVMMTLLAPKKAPIMASSLTSPIPIPSVLVIR